MRITIKKLEPEEIMLAKDLFIWFQVDDREEKLLVPGDHYLRTLLLREDFHVLVAMDETKVIGGLTAFELPMYKEEVNEMFLYEIGVNEAYRKRSVATDLINYLKQLALQRGINEMYVGTDLENMPAQKLYAKTGGRFEKIAWYVYKLG